MVLLWRRAVLPGELRAMLCISKNVLHRCVFVVIAYNLDVFRVKLALMDLDLFDSISYRELFCVMNSY